MTTVSTEDYQRFAKALKQADKAMARAIRKRTREAAVPIGEHVVRDGSEVMPERGGLSARLAAGKPAVSVAAKGATINLRKGANYAALNRGILRHPVYGTGRWVEQRVPEGTYTEAFADLPPEARAKLDLILTDAMKELNLP